MPDTQAHGSDPRMKASSLQMARNLGLSTVAEGVERKEQLYILREMGCDLAQGDLLANPKRPDELVNGARNRQPTHAAI